MTSFGVGPFQVEPYEPIEQAINIGIAAVSLILLALSLSAYRKTGMRRILYAAAAFGLFAVQRTFEFLEEPLGGVDAPYNDVIVAGITLAILGLFFMAIVTKK
jgi:transketolase C-terminal domain/subunit